MNLNILNVFILIIFAQLKYGFSTFTMKPPKSTKPNQRQVQTRQLADGNYLTNIVSGTITCVCVPTGQCNYNLPSDGSGQIDIRIVTNTSSSGTTTGPKVCQKGLVRCCYIGSYRCGIRYPPVEGSPTPNAGQSQYGEYPWQAVILTTNNVFVGSGALIDQKHILTAAHKISSLPISSLKVRLGEWDAATTTEPIVAQEFSIASTYIHPNFNSNNLRNSIAIVRLLADVPLGETPTITTGCLPATSFTGQRCWVSGWGKDDFNSGTYQAIQKEVDVLIKSSSECQSALSATRLGSNFVFDNSSFLCAGGESGKDACTGDGGAPLMCQLGSRWFVVGLVAWGIGCATQNVPGVYIRVSNYVSWIQTIISS